MTADWRTRIDAAVDGSMDRMIALRRHLHAHPEPSGKELQSSLHLYRIFDEMGLAVRMGPEGCGVIVESRNPNDRPRIALRADIDALRINDQKQTPYRSTVPEVMHACGHDAHTATMYGALLALDRLECDRALPWSVTWRGIFQPAEESGDGAKAMMAAGALDGVGRCAAHVDQPGRPADWSEVWSLTASCDDMRITVAAAAHAARPRSNDPIAAAAEFVSTLYRFVPRDRQPGCGRRFVCRFMAGKIRTSSRRVMLELCNTKPRSAKTVQPAALAEGIGR